MDKAQEVDGKDFMLFLNIDSAYKATALAKSCTVTLNAEIKDTSSKDSGIWKDSKVVGFNWGMKTDNAVSVDSDIINYEAIRTAFLKGEPVLIGSGIPDNKGLKLPEGGWTVPTSMYGGKALITSLELTASKGETCSFSASFEGVGEYAEITQTKKANSGE